MGTLFAIPFLLGAWWLASAVIGPLDVLALFAYDLPDSDTRKVRKKDVPFVKGGTKHRHWFWHSSIIVIIVFLVAARIGMFTGMGTFCAVLASHLFADIKIRGLKTGTYCIYVRKGHRLTARQTDRYLLANGIICLALGTLSLFL